MTKSSSGLSEPSQPIKSLPAGNDKTTIELAGITNEEDKIAAAYKYIKDVFDENVEKVKAHAITKAHETMLSIGEYIVRNFYQNDYDLAKIKQVVITEGKTIPYRPLTQLIDKIQSKGDGQPSKTFIYDSVRLVTDVNLFSNSPVSSAYGELGHSIKVNLTYAPDNINIKEKLIKEAVEKKYTVAGLRKRIVEERRLLDKDYISLEEPISEEKLKSFDNDKLIKFQKKIEKDKTELQNNINELNAKIALYTANISSIATQIALKAQEEANTAAQQVQTNIVSTEHPAV